MANNTTTADSYVFYRSFEESFEDIDDMTELKVRRAISRYALYGEEPELKGIASAMFKLISPVIDASQKRRKNGNLGGRPKKEDETNGYKNEKPMVSEIKTNGFNNAKPDKEVEVEADVETEMEEDEEVENESSSASSSSSFLVLSSVTSDVYKKPTAKQVIKVLSDSGFSDYIAETAGNKFWTYFNNKNWSFLKYNSWTNKLSEWVPDERILNDEREKIIERRAKEKEEEEKERLRWEEFDAKYYDNHPDPFSIVQNADDFVTYIRGNKHFQFDDETCKRMDHFFLDEELIQMYEDGAVNTDEQYGSCIKYLYACGQCKELIEHFNHGHERAYGMEPFVWKSREEEQKEIEKLRAAREDEFAYEEEEYDDLPFS